MDKIEIDAHLLKEFNNELNKLAKSLLDYKDYTKSAYILGLITQKIYSIVQEIEEDDEKLNQN
jgi:hypothetical protein